MTRSRYVWLTPRDLRRDFGPVDDLRLQEDGASGRLRYVMPSAREKTALLLLAAGGAGLALAAPLLVIGGYIGAAPAIGIGALYAMALRLALIVRTRDRTLGHHGRFLPLLSRIRVERVHRRSAVAAMRLHHTLAAWHGLDDARDLSAAIVLRAAGPVAAGLWLGSSALLPGAALGATALALGLLAGSLAERHRQSAAFRAEVARAAFARHASRLVAALPTLRGLGAANGAIDRVRRRIPLTSEKRAVQAALRTSALFRLAIPAIAIVVLFFAVGMPPVTILGIAVATVAAGHAGAALGVQGSRIAQARQRRCTAERLFSREAAPTGSIERIEALEARDLAFRYGDAAGPVFEQVSFTLRSGEILALSSPSGSGKTTLLRLITGLAEPCGGQVLVNGGDARELAWRHRVAAVFQDEPVGAGTIRAAIAGSAPIGLDAVWAAAARVGADALIRALPMEMQTLIVEGPFPPSLLQPLLIARALAQQPDLLILDEALGALPYDRAEQVLESLRAEGKLVIFASHDPRIVALADKVLDLEAGRRPVTSGAILPVKA